MRITEAEVLNELQKIAHAAPNAEGYATGDLVDLTGWPESRVRRTIKAMIRQQLAKPCRVKRKAMDGRLMDLPGYQFVTTGKKKR